MFVVCIINRVLLYNVTSLSVLNLCNCLLNHFLHCVCLESVNTFTILSTHTILTFFCSTTEGILQLIQSILVQHVRCIPNPEIISFLLIIDRSIKRLIIMHQYLSPGIYIFHTFTRLYKGYAPNLYVRFYIYIKNKCVVRLC